MYPKLSALLVVLSTFWLSSCGGNSPASTSHELNDDGLNGIRAKVTTLYLVPLENASYQSVIGNSAMPFINTLAKQNALATQFFADAHPSLPNYFMLTTGQTITNNDTFAGTVNADNLVRELGGIGASWRVYAESLPAPGYLGGDAYPYIKHHNPFAYFSDDANQAQNLRPFSEFAADIAADKMANYNFIIPNNLHNAHDCPGGGSCSENTKLGAADNWLSENLSALLASSTFQQHGLLIITFDEGQASDSANGGGHIVTVLAGAMVKHGFRSTTVYQHQSILRLTLELLNAENLPGAAADAAPMDEFFVGH